MSLIGKPRYKHDCTKCVFVAPTLNVRGEVTDWYVCHGSDPSVIGRRSDRVADYWSMPLDMVKDQRYEVSGHGDTHVLYETRLVAQAIVRKHEEK